MRDVHDRASGLEDHVRDAIPFLILLAACTGAQMASFGPEAAQRLEQTGELAKAVAEYKDAYAASWVRGQTMGLEQAIGFARAPAKHRRSGSHARLTRRGKSG